MNRYPAAALCDALGMSFTDMAQTVGLDPERFQSVRRWGFTPDEADRFAVAVGLHPHEVWPVMLDERDTRRRALAAARKRKQRQDPARREADRLRSAAYYAAYREGLAAQERRRYWSDPEKHRARKRAARAAS